MYIIPLIRTSRALTACTLMPHNPFLAVTLSETISYVLPFVNNSKSITDIIFFTFYLFNEIEYGYNYFILYLINKYKNKYIFYYNIELFTIGLYLIYYFT